MGLDAVSDIVVEEWAFLTNVQILLLTDNIDNLHSSSIKNLCIKLKENQTILKEFYAFNGNTFDERLHNNSILNTEELLKSSFYSNYNKKIYFQVKYPFSFPNRFDVICLNHECDAEQLETVYGFSEDGFKFKKFQKKRQNKIFYLNELIQLNNSSGKLFATSKVLHEHYIENEFLNTVIAELYKPFECQLKFGHMQSSITLTPSPNKFNGYQNFSFVTKEISKSLEICGFVGIAELTTPPNVSRHLITPSKNYNENSINTFIRRSPQDSITIQIGKKYYYYHFCRGPLYG